MSTIPYVDFDVFKRAGIQSGTLAVLVGVSRQSASGWMNSSRQPMDFIRSRVLDYQKAAQDLIDEGVFPLEDTGLSRMERDARITRLIRARREVNYVGE
jgi:hypothetical protein